ncbi:MAG: PH domain-containing protein [Candidatus Micrarchaeota archaeon]
MRKLRLVYWGFLTISLFLFMALVSSALEVISPLNPEVFVLVLMLSILSGEIYARLLIKSYRYGIDDDSVNFEGGVLIKTRRKISFHKVTDVTTTQDTFDQALGLSTLHVKTGGSDPLEITFYGLKDPSEPENIIKGKLTGAKPQE